MNTTGRVLQEPAARMVAVDLGVAHVAGEHLEGPVPRDLLDFEDAGAGPRRAGDEPGPQRMPAEQRRIVAGYLRRLPEITAPPFVLLARWYSSSPDGNRPL